MLRALQNPSWVRVNEGGKSYLCVKGRRWPEGEKAYVDGDSVFLQSDYPGQPPRQIAGPGTAAQNIIILIGLSIGLGMMALQLFGPLLR